MCELGWAVQARMYDTVNPEWGLPLDEPEGEWPEFDFGDLFFEDEEEEEDDSDPEFDEVP